MACCIPLVSPLMRFAEGAHCPIIGKFRVVPVIFEVAHPNQIIGTQNHGQTFVLRLAIAKHFLNGLFGAVYHNVPINMAKSKTVNLTSPDVYML